MQFKLAFLAPVVCLTMNSVASHALAQESLAGVGAASAMGATLGASAAGSLNTGRLTGGIGGRTNRALDQQDQQDPNFPNPNTSGAGAAAAAPVTTPSVPLAAPKGSGESILGQLLSRPFQPVPTDKKRSAKGQAAYVRKVARLSAKGRKKLVLQKYKIAPNGYLSTYLPQDRYKFAKAWKFVSTETDHFYYTPQGMAGHRFNPNKVIGFRTWQDAMLAGYRPDPGTKPLPGNQIAFLASLTRDEPLVNYVEYIYAGQVSPESLTATYDYVRDVKATVDKNPQARQYQRETVNKILIASLTGDSSIIPKVFGEQPAPAANALGQGGPEGIGGGLGGFPNGAPSGPSSFPGAPQSATPVRDPNER